MRITVILICILCTCNVYAQLDLPDWSPRASVKQRIGYTKFTLEYGRPAARGRSIMGEVVKYGKLWRTGASQGTWISFDRPVSIASKTVAPGIYALLTIPDKTQWTVLLNTDTSKSYGDPSEYDVKNEVLRFTVQSEKSSHFHESLTIRFDIIHYDAVLYLNWENVQIHFPIKTGADEEAMRLIESSLAANPNNDEMLGSAAFYYSMNQKDPAKALEFLDKAIALREDRWYYRQKMSLLAKSKKYSEARKAAAQAVTFLTSKKPEHWEESVKSIEEEVANWPK